MTTIVETFVTYLKSKQLRDWDLMALENFVDDCASLYKYTDNKDDEKVLKIVYTKMTEWLNAGQRGKIFYNSLSHVDKMKEEIGTKR